MSRFFSSQYSGLTPYVPGEQPQGKDYVKLNTNESPFPPSPYAQRLARQAAGDLELYSDPECRDLVAVACEKLGVAKEEILFTNGSDEALNFAFMAFCDDKTPAVFADITYGFYPVFATLNGVPFETIPLKEDFLLDYKDYLGIQKTIFIANPNAPTGKVLPLSEIEEIVKSNPNNVVVVDEAYVDFGGESALPLTKQYDNLLVCQTFSKSRSMAGARLGFAVGNSKLIQDLNTIKYSTNPYNVNRMTMAAGIGALLDTEYFKTNCQTIISNREETIASLQKMGFTVLDSKANFVFAKSNKLSGKELYEQLKEKGVLVRYFDKDRIRDFVRITIGSKEQMAALISALEELL
ncbi:MAG: histidinol-phosphate transaminase [Clostridia bacterium]|nr:histidinol-phosphate transaminase [Clostridia bacterium]